MKITKYVDQDGKTHAVSTEYSFGGYVIYLDGKLYAQADDRIELDDAIRELLTYKEFTVARSQKSQKNISSPKPASKRTR